MSSFVAFSVFGLPDLLLQSGSLECCGQRCQGGPAGTFGEGGPGLGNVLSDRFLEVEEFAEMVDAELERLTAELIDSGMAAELLAERVAVLADSGLVDQDVLDEEADAIADYLR